MIKKLESYAAHKYDKDEKSGRSSSRRSSGRSSSSSPKRSKSPSRSSSPPKRSSSSSSQYHDVQSRYLDPNPKYSPSNNTNQRMLSPFFSRLTHSKNPNPWVPNKNLTYVGIGDKGSSPDSNSDARTTTTTTTTTSRKSSKYDIVPKHKDHLKGSRLK